MLKSGGAGIFVMAPMTTHRGLKLRASGFPLLQVPILKNTEGVSEKGLHDPPLLRLARKPQKIKLGSLKFNESPVEGEIYHEVAFEATTEVGFEIEFEVDLEGDFKTNFEGDSEVHSGREFKGPLTIRLRSAYDLAQSLGA